MTTKFYEKILPNQEKFTNLYYESEPIEKKIYEMAEELCGKSVSLSYVHDDITQEEMGSGTILLEYLKYTISTNKYKNILEIGTFLGASAIEFGNELKNKGTITTIEKYANFASIAQKNIENEKLINVNIIHGDALEVIHGLAMDKINYDFIFIDGDKSNYDRYLQESMKILSNGGTIVVDDIFFHGDSLNEEPRTDKGLGAKKCLNFAKKIDKNLYSVIILPISNGILQVTKK
jgi:caffeoyl-CoA O-methyltransferase